MFAYYVFVAPKSKAVFRLVAPLLLFADFDSN